MSHGLLLLLLLLLLGPLLGLLLSLLPLVLLLLLFLSGSLRPGLLLLVGLSQLLPRKVPRITDHQRPTTDAPARRRRPLHRVRDGVMSTPIRSHGLSSPTYTHFRLSLPRISGGVSSMSSRPVALDT